MGRFPFLGMDRMVPFFFRSGKGKGFCFPNPSFHPQIIPLEEKELLGLQDPAQQIHDPVVGQLN